MKRSEDLSVGASAVRQTEGNGGRQANYPDLLKNNFKRDLISKRMPGIMPV